MRKVSTLAALVAYSAAIQASDSSFGELLQHGHDVEPKGPPRPDDDEASPATYNWTCVPEWSGIALAMAIDSNGDIACWSTDGINCLRSRPCHEVLSGSRANMKPLSCGCKHKRHWQSTGYNSPTHWCSLGALAFGITPPNLPCTGSTPTPPTPPTSKPHPSSANPAHSSHSPVPSLNQPTPPSSSSAITTSAPPATTSSQVDPTTTTTPTTEQPAPPVSTTVATPTTTDSSDMQTPQSTGQQALPTQDELVSTTPGHLHTQQLAPASVQPNKVKPSSSPSEPPLDIVALSSGGIATKKSPDLPLTIASSPASSGDGVDFKENVTGSADSPVSPQFQSSVQSSIALLGSDDPVNQAGRIVFNSVVAGTLAVLTAFHFTAMDPSVVPSASFGDSLWAPNLWELPTFFTFLQNMAIVAMASIDAPYAPFALFTDSFSWLLFLVKGAPSSDAMPASRRKLDKSIDDAFGIQQFALRLNIAEADMFVRAWTFVCLVISCVVLVLCIFNGLAFVLGSRSDPKRPESITPAMAYATKCKGWSQKLQGGLVWILTQSVLPLTAVSVFEATSSTPNSMLAFAILVVIGGVCVGTSVVLWQQSETSLSKYKTKAAFGVLYVNLRFQFRAFCGATLAVQFLSGVFMSGFVHPSTQMIWLIAIHTAYMFVLVGVRPLVTTLHLGVAVVVELVNIAIYGLCFAQANAAPDDLETKKRLGYVVMGLACLLVVLFFARTLVKLGKKLLAKGKDEGFLDDPDQHDGDLPTQSKRGSTDRVHFSTPTITASAVTLEHLHGRSEP